MKTCSLHIYIYIYIYTDAPRSTATANIDRCKKLHKLAGRRKIKGLSGGRPSPSFCQSCDVVCAYGKSTAVNEYGLLGYCQGVWAPHEEHCPLLFFLSLSQTKVLSATP